MGNSEIIKWTKSDAMFFFDRWIIPMIADEFKIDETKALRDFILSETYKMLADDETKLLRESPLFIFDLFKAERETGDPRNSNYIRTIHND
ncbi:MAG: hypothetical protein LBC98_03710 [Prevotellaceae bacterium]|jgi:hypothetical protein|nr:hypothetical protein [Prevotellaceae bacterium]